jgi:hypothetical protein
VVDRRPSFLGWRMNAPLDRQHMQERGALAGKNHLMRYDNRHILWCDY